MRDKLIELFLAPMKLPIHNPKDFVRVTAEAYADRLLENGIIVPPCKVGDTVYYIFEGEIRELTVISLSYMFSTTFKHFILHTTNYRGAVLSYEIKDIGKTVFRTREEAEEYRGG